MNIFKAFGIHKAESSLPYGMSSEQYAALQSHFGAMWQHQDDPWFNLGDRHSSDNAHEAFKDFTRRVGPWYARGLFGRVSTIPDEHTDIMNLPDQFYFYSAPNEWHTEKEFKAGRVGENHNKFKDTPEGHYGPSRGRGHGVGQSDTHIYGSASEMTPYPRDYFPGSKFDPAPPIYADNTFDPRTELPFRPVGHLARNLGELASYRQSGPDPANWPDNILETHMPNRTPDEVMEDVERWPGEHQAPPPPDTFDTDWWDSQMNKMLWKAFGIRKVNDEKFPQGMNEEDYNTLRQHFDTHFKGNDAYLLQHQPDTVLQHIENPIDREDTWHSWINEYGPAYAQGKYGKNSGEFGSFVSPYTLHEGLDQSHRASIEERFTNIEEINPDNELDKMLWKMFGIKKEDYLPFDMNSEQYDTLQSHFNELVGRPNIHFDYDDDGNILNSNGEIEETPKNARHKYNVREAWHDFLTTMGPWYARGLYGRVHKLPHEKASSSSNALGQKHTHYEPNPERYTRQSDYSAPNQWHTREDFERGVPGQEHPYPNNNSGHVLDDGESNKHDRVHDNHWFGSHRYFGPYNMDWFDQGHQDWYPNKQRDGRNYEGGKVVVNNAEEGYHPSVYEKYGGETASALPFLDRDTVYWHHVENNQRDIYGPIPYNWESEVQENWGQGGYQFPHHPTDFGNKYSSSTESLDPNE